MTLENYSKLDEILNEVHKEKIKIDKKDRTRAYILCDQMRDQVRKKLKESKSFLHTLENGITYRGSFFGGVKVGKPDEFDIDIQLKLPLNYNLIDITMSEPGYIKINIKDAYESMMETPTWANKYGALKQFMDKDGFLMESKIRTEMESVFSRQFGVGYFNLELKDGKLARVRMKKSGPAFTFELNVDDLKIDIDFVFVIYFDSMFWPPKPVRRFDYTPRSVNNYWFAVPKPTENPLSWRLSFPHQESFYLNGLNNLKSIYRLLKALRDANNWKLASYHIATLFLWVSDRHIDNPRFWRQSIGRLFIEMLAMLQAAMESHAVYFFWDNRCNMIKDVKAATLNNIANRISGMINQIDRKYNDSAALKKYIMADMFHIQNYYIYTGLNYDEESPFSKNEINEEESGYRCIIN